MATRLMLMMATMALVAACGTSGSALASTDCQDTQGSAAERPTREEICRLVNNERRAEGRPALKLDRELTELAQWFADDMNQKGYFSHEAPDGTSMSHRLKRFKIRYSAAGENIAQGQDSPGDVVGSWMRSPGHKENIMNGEYRKLGTARSGDYWVQVFTD